MISDVMIDRFLAGELSELRRADIEAQIAASPELAARVAERRLERAHFYAARPAELMAARIAANVRGRAPAVRSAVRRVHWLAPVLATAASIALVFKLSHQTSLRAPPPPASIVMHDEPAAPEAPAAVAPADVSGLGYAQPPSVMAKGALAKGAKKAKRESGPTFDKSADETFAQPVARQGAEGESAGVSENERLADAEPQRAEKPRGQMDDVATAAPPLAAAPMHAAAPPASGGAFAHNAAERSRASPASEVSGDFIRTDAVMHVGDTVRFRLFRAAYVVVLSETGDNLTVVLASGASQLSVGQLRIARGAVPRSERLLLFASPYPLDAHALASRDRSQLPVATLQVNVAP